MSLYSRAYAFVLKKNFMLLIIAITLLILTFGYWIGIPYFVVGNMLSELNAPVFIQGICISMSAGFFFSLFFISINFKVAKMVGEKKRQSTSQAFTRLQVAFVLLIAIILYLIFSLILWTQGVFQ